MKNYIAPKSASTSFCFLLDGFGTVCLLINFCFRTHFSLSACQFVFTLFSCSLSLSLSFFVGRFLVSLGEQSHCRLLSWSSPALLALSKALAVLNNFSSLLHFSIDGFVAVFFWQLSSPECECVLSWRPSLLFWVFCSFRRLPTPWNILVCSEKY